MGKVDIQINTPPKKKWKTAIYARLSFENNGLEDGRSLENQVEFGRAYIREHPSLHLIEEYVDNGRSGTNFQRPEFLRLMNDLRAGKINCIVVKDLSRFGRNYLETGYYLEKIFPFLNIRFIAINDRFDSMDTRKKDGILVPIKNIVNDLYAKDISRKITATLRVKEQKGEIWYGTAPYGYRKDPDRPYRLIVDADTADYVRLMFQWTLGGCSYGKIARQLTQMQAVTPKERLENQTGKGERSWANATVRKILHNPVYTGDTVYNQSHQSLAEQVRFSRVPKAEWNVVEHTHEAIVSREVFSRASQILDKREKRYQKSGLKLEERTADYPDVLEGVFFCSDCGRRMQYERKMRQDTFRCANYCCSGYRYNAGKPDWHKSEIADRLVRMLVLQQIRLQVKAGYRILQILEERSAAKTGSGAEADPGAGWRAAQEQKTVLFKVRNSPKLDRDLVQEMISRVTFGSDRVLRIDFRHGDWIQELEELEQGMQREEG